MKSRTPVILDRDGILIQGERKLLLCASLFYFRIPEELWRDRIRKLRLAGYNCADVYFPWNYHEMAQNEWCFEGSRDVDAFLGMFAEEGIFVVARPGPYICSEWDGGSIPGRLLSEGATIRTDDPAWLAEVSAWYDRILPLIAKHQVHRGGSVILLQVENELDFFDCPAPGPYMGKLAGMARAHGIDVPVFGCAGQGSAEGATGFAPDVVPTYNFYPSAFEPGFDPVCLAVHQALREKDLPFLITETGREHFLLRREMANGARLLGAYNQVGGTNFGFTASINNWGKGTNPLSFLATEYDFASMIDAAGGFREEALEGRLLGGMLGALGEPLAIAKIRSEHAQTVTWDVRNPKNNGATRLLDMGDNGALLCVPNFSEKAACCTVDGSVSPIRVAVGPWHAPFLPFDVPLERTGVRAVLRQASAEVLSQQPGHLILHAENLEGVVPEALIESVDGVLMTLSGFGRHERVLGGKTLVVEILEREEARRLDIGFGAFPYVVDREPEQVSLPDGLVRRVQPETAWMSKRVPEGSLRMEALGLSRGAATYGVSVTAGRSVVLQQAADIVQSWRNEVFDGTRVSGGQWQLYAGATESVVDPALAQKDTWSFRTDIWGHSNFDDARQPAMRIASGKGVCAIFQVDAEDSASLAWRFRQMEHWLPETLPTEIGPMDPILSPNAWNTTRMPLVARYSVRWSLKPGSDACALRMAEPQAETAVYVDGRLAGVLNPQDPWMDLTEWFSDHATHTLSLLCRKRHWAEPAGIPSLYHMTRLAPEVCGWDDRDVERVFRLESPCLNDAADGRRLMEDTRDIERLKNLNGLAVEAGTMLEVRISLDGMPPDCRHLRLRMRDMKATVLFNGRLLGRVFGNSACRPDIVGGDAERVYVPGPWYLSEGNCLILLLEGLGNDATLDAAVFETAGEALR